MRLTVRVPRARPRLLPWCSAAASIATLVLTVLWSERAGVVTVALLVAVAWATAISVTDAAAVGSARSGDTEAELEHGEPREHGDDEAGASLSYVVRLGDERPDVARTSLLLATRLGPVHVAATEHRALLDDLDAATVIEHVAPTMHEAVAHAVDAVTTEAVLVLSASAYPVAGAGEAAGRITEGGAGWVVGVAPAFNLDRYAPREREALASRVRGAARAFGVVTWEPDATIVRTSLLREHSFEPDRPDGDWLRARARDGVRGVTAETTVAVRAAPADAPVFWRSRTRRQRGAVADLAGAATAGPLRARAVATGALLRELFAYPVLAWLVAIVLIGRSGHFPLSVPAAAFFAVQASAGALRWAASRVAYGIGLHPVDEGRAFAYDLPGSLLALPAALTRRVRRGGLVLPDQPLLWAALVLTLLATAPLADRHAATSAATGVAVGLTLAALGAAWVFAIRAFGARGWDRASYRFALDRAATVDGHPARTLDASPSGLALAGVPRHLGPGAVVDLTIVFDDATTIALRGTVTDRRTTEDQASIGVALDLDAPQRADWTEHLFAATGMNGPAPAIPVAHAPRRRLALQRPRIRLRDAAAALAPAGALLVVSAVALGLLVLALFGYRPMVERSGSMIPTLRVGDVVITEWVPAERLRPREIVTFPERFGRTELVTHRVQRVEVDGALVRVVTKGDANLNPEHWSVPRGTLVGHVVWSVPRAGALVILLGDPLARELLLAAGLAFVVLGVLAALGRRRVATVERRIAAYPPLPRGVPGAGAGDR